MGGRWRFSCRKHVVKLWLMMMIVCSSNSSAAKVVTFLPGFDGELPFHLETGYVTVNDKSGSEYFYYFVESERNPSEDPLLLWLIGGPYCSGLVGLALNMGPLNFEGDAYNDKFPTLVYNPYSWTKICNIIFLDWPVGTGFSFSKNPESYSYDDLQSSKEIYEFLKKWLLLYPHFLSNPFYIGGDSYGGIIVPLVSKEIVQGNELGQNQPHALVINIKGYLVGNGLTSKRIDDNAQIPSAHRLGIISDEIFELIVKSCRGEEYTHPVSAGCASNMNTYSELLAGINLVNILTPYCPMSLRERRRSIMEKSYTETILYKECSKDRSMLADKWGNSHLSWNALHIKEGTIEQWHYCNVELDAKYTNNIQNVVPYHMYLAKKSYRALVYSGDHDLRIPYLGTLEWIRSLNFSVIQRWRSWHVGNQIAGYTILFSNNLTFATILGGSHTPSDNRPAQSFSMFERWLSHDLL